MNDIRAVSARSRDMNRSAKIFLPLVLASSLGLLVSGCTSGDPDASATGASSGPSSSASSRPRLRRLRRVGQPVGRRRQRRPSRARPPAPTAPRAAGETSATAPPATRRPAARSTSSASRSPTEAAARPAATASRSSSRTPATAPARCRAGRASRSSGAGTAPRSAPPPRSTAGRAHDPEPRARRRGPGAREDRPGRGFDAATCQPTATDGFRIYPPGSVRSIFVGASGSSFEACANTAVQQLSTSALAAF